MAENIKQRGLNVTVTFDEEKLREIVDEMIIKQGLEQVVHCKDCKYAMALVDGARAILCTKQDWATIWNIDDYCSYGERKE